MSPHDADSAAPAESVALLGEEPPGPEPAESVALLGEEPPGPEPVAFQGVGSADPGRRLSPGSSVEVGGWGGHSDAERPSSLVTLESAPDPQATPGAGPSDGAVPEGGASGAVSGVSRHQSRSGDGALAGASAGAGGGVPRVGPPSVPVAEAKRSSRVSASDAGPVSPAKSLYNWPHQSSS
ncbi:hypothetical protein [Streptomyces sp. NPDC088816]|uniref:hypothetical protein n=1 Tax=Streptomyces sp. NPDC088816 TaxID=3365906 RepID=UPI00382DB045